jgi:hypothetical protein
MIGLLFAMTLAAAEPEVVAAPPTPPPKETVGQRRRRERAEAQKQVVCRTMTPTGTNMPQEVCQTQAEWDKIRLQALDDARMLSDVSRNMPR